MKKRVLSLIICMVLALSMIQNPILVGATEETEDTNRLYAKTEVSEYRTNGTYPEKTGYLFAGWYEDATYETPVTGDTPENGAYAKYVDEKVLNMKFQFTNGTTTISASTNLRLITSVDSREYQQVGFVVQVKGYEPSTITCDKVYNTIYGYADEGKISYTPKKAFENNDSQYFATKILMGVAKAAFSREIKVTPFWTTMDGTTVSGTKRTIVISELFNVYYELDLSEVNTGFLPSTTTVEGVTVQLKNSSITDKVTVCEDATTQEKYIEVTGTSSGNAGIRIGNSKIDFSSGVKIIAFDLKIDSISDNKGVDLWVKETDKVYSIAKLKVDGAIQYRSAGSGYTDNEDNITCEQGEWASVVLVVNSDKDTYTLYYDGVEVVKDVQFYAAQSTGLAEIQIYADKDDQTNFDIRNFVIYDEISVTDEANVYYELDLSEQNTGAWVSGTKVNNVKISTKGSGVTVKREATTDKKYIAVNDTSTTAEAGIRIGDRTNSSYVIDFSSGVKTIAFDLKINSLTANFVNLWVLDSSGTCANMGFKAGGYIQYRSDGSGYTDNAGGITWKQGVWVSVNLVVNSDTKTYSMYYDGVEVVKDAPFFQELGTGMVEIQIYGTAACQSNFAIKDFVIYDEVSGSSIVDDNIYYELDLSEQNTGAWTNKNVDNVKISNKSTSAAATVEQETTTNKKYFAVNDTLTTADVGIRIGDRTNTSYALDFSSGVKTIAFDLKINSISSNYVSLWVMDRNTSNSDCTYAIMGFKAGGYIQYRSGGSGYTDNADGIIWKQGDWVSVKLVVDSDAETYSMYYGGVEVVKDVPFYATPGTGMVEIQIYGSKDHQSNFAIRDFVIYKGEISAENRN